MIDSHCHLTDPRLSGQLDRVLAHAAGAGVARLITIGTTVGDARNAIELCHRHPNVRCAIGVHPNYSHEARIEDVEAIRQLQCDPCVLAIGEMGLDYFHKFADRATQLRFFEAQLAIAGGVNKPVVIHSRDAIDDTLAVLRAFPAVRAVFHCFTGTSAEAERIIDAGYLIGFTGPLTYKKNDDLRKAARRAPRDRVLIETDAPYLSPEPVRSQKTNEPAFVAHVCARLADVWETSVEEVDAITTRNVERFFGWDAEK